MKFTTSILSLGLLALTMMSGSAHARVGNDVDKHGCNHSAGYTWCKTTNKCARASDCPAKKVIGNDVDKHGCNHSAGYTYCKTTKKCVREWETPCPSSIDGGDVDKHGCKPSTGYTWCDTTKSCERECPKAQCGRKCSSNYDCSNEGGRMDKGQPWCGLCDHNHCRPHYEDCESDSDCGSKAVCDGSRGICVGK